MRGEGEEKQTKASPDTPMATKSIARQMKSSTLERKTARKWQLQLQKTQPKKLENKRVAVSMPFLGSRKMKEN